MLRALVVIAATLVLTPDVRPAPAGDPAFYIIVNRANAVTSLTRAEVSAMFMKKVRRWGDGSDVFPVDQSSASQVRDRFSLAIHGKSVAYVTRYWHRLIFSGRGIPPAEATSNDAVIELVRANRGAIGYVSAGTVLPNDVRLVAVTK